MKFFGFLLFASAAFAAPACVTASLHTYDSAAFSCSEGAETFSNFAFTDSGSENPSPTDSSITVSPLALGGLQFGAGFAAPAAQTLDAAITYTTVSATGFTTDTLSILGFGVSGNASIDVAESICVGAAFAANGTCPTHIVSLNAFDNANGMQPSATAAIPAGVTTLGVAKDISIIGGSGMSAANLSLVDNATPVGTATTPEPGTLLLVGAGLLGLVRLSKRRGS